SVKQCTTFLWKEETAALNVGVHHPHFRGRQSTFGMDISAPGKAFGGLQEKKTKNFHRYGEGSFRGCTLVGLESAKIPGFRNHNLHS
ncbi:hypothetical protein ACJMK2_042640, partial [Sinanodonta woodiana]